MTKQVHIQGYGKDCLNERELLFLQMLEGDGTPVVLSVAEVGARIGVKPETARRVIRRTSSKGYVEYHKRFQSNGGQLENEYLLTPSGRRLLAAWERQQRPERRTVRAEAARVAPERAVAERAVAERAEIELVA